MENEKKELNFIELQNFLKEFKEKNLYLDKKKELILIVNSLKKRTEAQKRRFITFYNLESREDNKNLTYVEMAKREKCSSSAISNSITMVTLNLVHLKDSRRNKLLEIIN